MDKNSKIPLPILLLIYSVLIFAIYNSVATLSLGFFGSTAKGVVDSYHSRLDESGAPANRSRTITKGYYFTVGGK